MFGDVIVGGAGNIAPSAVWGCVRLTLTVVTNLASFREQVSELFMEIGQTAPRHQEIAMLYPKSKRRQSDLTEYFIVIVLLCQRLFRPSVVGRIKSRLRLALVDPELKNLKGQLDNWANSIDREINLLIGKRVEEESKESSRFRSLWAGITEAEKKRKRPKAHLAWLNACSRYDYEKDRKRIRKQGNSRFFLTDTQYQGWRDRAFTVGSVSVSNQDLLSSTLLCRGILGSGKSVLLANMVDDLILERGERKYSVVYFFVTSEDSESQKATTILGSLARQMLEMISDYDWLDSPDLASNMPKDHVSPSDMMELLCKVFPADRKVFVVLDGLGQCPRSERLDLLSHLERLCRSFQLLICCSLREEVNLQPHRYFMFALRPDCMLDIPIDNPDIKAFVDTEIEYMLRLGDLVIGSQAVLEEIKQCLVGEAAGMFLWAVLQLQTIALARSDKVIRQALKDIPHSLPGTYEQILTKSRGFGPQYQPSILKILSVALELLTMHQLGEAISIVPGDTSWSDEDLINDVNITLASCGSLIVVDEEGLTVRFVHPSVRQFLFGEMRDTKMPVPDTNGQEFCFSPADAHREMTAISVTYLTIFDTTRQVILHEEAASPMASKPTAALVPPPSQAINAVIQSGVMSKRLVKVVTRIYGVRRASKTQRVVDIQNAISDHAADDSHHIQQNKGVFLPYAKSHWLVHSTSLHDRDGPVYNLWRRLVRNHDWHKALRVYSYGISESTAPFSWALIHSHHPLLELLLKEHKKGGRLKILVSSLREVFSVGLQLYPLIMSRGIDPQIATRCLTLSLLLRDRGVQITSKLLAAGPDLCYRNYSALYLGVILGNQAVVRRLLRCITQTSTDDNPHKHTRRILSSLPYPLIERAVLNSDPRTVHLLVKHGANIHIHSPDRRHPIVEALTLMVTTKPPDPRHILVLSILLKACGTPEANVPRDIIKKKLLRVVPRPSSPTHV